MASRGVKRKRYVEMKNDLSVELHRLTVVSGEYNNDVREATLDFEQMFKSMADRQNDFLSRSLLLEEKYGEVVAILNKGKKETVGEPSGENVVLPPGYAENVNKFVHDARTSLKSHGDLCNEEYDQIDKILQKYRKVLDDNMKELRSRAVQIEIQRTNLNSKLDAFVRLAVED